MTDTTEQKILDVALKLFAEKGYTGATNRLIANETGFTEMTIYRKFKSKNKLFHSVLIQNNEKMMKELGSVFVEKEFDTSRDFLETLIRNLMELCKNNFEIIKITLNENSRIPGNFVEDFIDTLSAYVEKNIQNNEMNCRTLAFTILSFIYLLILDYGRSFKYQDEVINKFIDNIFICP